MLTIREREQIAEMLAQDVLADDEDKIYALFDQMLTEARAQELAQAANQLSPSLMMPYLYERESCDWWGEKSVAQWLRERADLVKGLKADA